MKINHFRALILSAALLSILPAGAQSYSVDWHTVDGGGGTSSGGIFILSGSIGPPDAGKMSGGDYALEGGFWGGIAEAQTSGAPPLSITHSNGYATLAWPDTAAGYQLEQSSDISVPGGWTIVLATGNTNAGVISITVPAGIGNTFFRLKNP